MLSVRTILVPIDFNASSDDALAIAVRLAQTLDAGLLVMHAFDVPYYGYPASTEVSVDALAERLGAAAERNLEAIAADVSTTWPRVTTVVRRGSASAEIVAVAEEQSVDLVIMGTHGRTGIAHTLLGSVAENVVRASRVPVMTVRHTPRAVASGEKR